MRNQLIMSVLTAAVLSACGAANKTADGPPAIQKLDDAAAYKAIYESEIPVLIEFCPDKSEPSSVVTELAEKHRGQFNLVRMNSDKSPDTMQLYDVQCVPALVFVSKKQCKHGKLLAGVSSPQEIEVFIDQSLIQCRE